MLQALDWGIIFFYVLIVLLIGLYYRKKSGNSLSDFFLGGRNLPWWLAGISMVATTFAADTPLVVTELVGEHGIAGNWLWWNMLIGGMLTTFFFSRLWRRAGVLTELEFIKIRYSGKKSVFLRGIRAVYISLIMNTLIIAWVNIALMTILEVFFGIEGRVLLLVVFLAMFIAGLYSVVSGLLGIAVTDLVQFIIAMLGAIVLAVIVVGSEKVGGISGLKSHLPSTAFRFFPFVGTSKIGGVLSLSVGSFFAYGLVQWWSSWYPGAEPGGGGYVAQRMMSTKNEKHSVFATLFFQVAHYAVRPWPWILVGLSAVVLYPDLSSSELRFGYVYAIRDFLPAGFKGLVLVGFLAAYMSTISTQLNFGASILTNDFYLLFVKEKGRDNLGSSRLVWVGRFFTILIMFISLFVTTQVETISGVWKFMIECGAGLGLVLILRWYWWRINAWSELTAMVVPFIFYGLSRFVFRFEFPVSFFVTVGGTTVLWVLVTYLTKPTDDSVLMSFYDRVKPQGSWGRYSGGFVWGNIFNLLGAWLSSIVLVYSLLFLVGKLIFGFWGGFFVYFVTAIFSFIFFLYFVRRSGVFED